MPRPPASDVPPALPLDSVLGAEASDKRIAILQRIAQLGSISQAARDAGVSYKAAWQALETLANLAGTPLVHTAVGGSGGGGARLTDAGRQVLLAAERLAQARQQVLHSLASAGAEPSAGAAQGAVQRAASALRTSMRNQFPCTVGSIRPLKGQLRVQLLLAAGQAGHAGKAGQAGQAVHARITRESAQLLGLERGLPVLALCKATAVQVAPQIAPSPGRNLLQGVVSRVSRAAAGGELVLQLSSGVQVVGFAAAGHGLRIGQAASLAVDDSGVVVARLD